MCNGVYAGQGPITSIMFYLLIVFIYGLIYLFIWACNSHGVNGLHRPSCLLGLVAGIHILHSILHIRGLPKLQRYRGLVNLNIVRNTTYLITTVL
jgi:hypothetical protein